MCMQIYFAIIKNRKEKNLRRLQKRTPVENKKKGGIIVKKRILGLLCCLAMLAAMLPMTVSADAGTSVKTYDELVEALQEIQMGYVSVSPSEDFGWPQSGTLTIPANVGISVGGSWEIPNGITVNFATNCYGIKCGTLSIGGTMCTAYSSQDSVLRDCNTVVIKPGAAFACSDDRPEYGKTLCSIYIKPGQQWVVESGATLNPFLRLDGTLTGSGTVSGTINVQGGFSGSASSGSIAGNLTLTGSVQVGRENSEYQDVLTIPAGSNISYEPSKYLAMMLYSGATLRLDGNLDVGSRTDDGNGIGFAEGGSLQMGEGSVLSVTYPHELSDARDFSAGQKVTPPEEPFITGSGTIKFYATDVENLPRYSLFGYDLIDKYADFESVQQTLIPGYIDSGVTLWRSWDNSCAHVWEEISSTPATCTTDGSTTYQCSQCQQTRVDPIPALGHDWDEGEVTQEPTTTTEGIRTYSCSRCDEIRTEPIPVIWENTYGDVADNAWYYRSVAFCSSRELIAGTGNGNFSPDTSLDRSMLVTILYRYAEKPPVDGSSSFTDVPAGQWYSDAIAWAQENSVVAGITETTFGPFQPVTREQMAAIFYRFASKSGIVTDDRASLDGFADGSRVSSYAKDAISWCVAKGILSGSNDKLNPQSSATRAEFSSILMRYITKVAEVR